MASRPDFEIERVEHSDVPSDPIGITAINLSECGCKYGDAIGGGYQHLQNKSNDKDKDDGKDDYL